MCVRGKDEKRRGWESLGVIFTRQGNKKMQEKERGERRVIIFLAAQQPLT
jgi:hypothetical protein